MALTTIRTRQEALKLGLKTYFTGLPCPKGHVAERSTKRCNCSQCKKEETKIRDNHPEQKKRIRNRVLKKQYNIDHDMYDKLLIAQAGGCFICGTEKADSRGHSLCVDHDHRTGRVRGLLCLNCNRGIGAFRDDPKLLRKAIYYLGVKR